MPRALERTLIAFLSAAVGAGAVIALWQPWQSTRSQPKVITQPKAFGSYYHPVAAARPGELSHLYWLGSNVGTCTPFVHSAKGNVERGVITYAANGDPNRTCVLVRVLDTHAGRGTAATVAGAALLKQMRHGTKLSSDATQMSARRAIVKPDPSTVVEITVVDSSAAAVPPVKDLAAAVAPLPQR